jgi:acyl transferase domain-containing protein/acyl carrier protein
MTMDTFDDSYDDAVAVIGMALRAPGATDPDGFWHLIREGHCAISTFSSAQQTAANVPPETMAHPDYVPKGGVLADIDMFDAAFFGFTPREAACLSPQNRLLFECVWEALESGGQNPREGRGRTGLFVGQSVDSYWPTFVAPHTDDIDAGLAFYSNPDFLATGIAYKLDLRGPAMTVQSFCSTSLLAVHLARQSLLEGECDMALAGGTSIRVPQCQGYTHVPDSIYSPDGIVRAFDANANGTLFGNGVGVVLLKRLQDALEDGDPIQTIIRGSAANNDGGSKAGYNAPSIDGQARAVARAMSEANIPAESIGYVECHGTGTLVGDPIEIAALDKAFRRFTDRRGFCAVGSVKPNVGHLDLASGVFGLIKAALALRHGEIPQVINYQTPNPRIDFATSPFYVPKSNQPWPKTSAPRRAGVNSLGYGGTNVHLVLEEPPVLSVRPFPTAPQLLLLSARTATALKAAAKALADHLDANPDLRLDDVAHTLRVGRHGFNHRRAIVACDTKDAVALLRTAEASKETTIRNPLLRIDADRFQSHPLSQSSLAPLLAELGFADQGLTDRDLSAALADLFAHWGAKVAPPSEYPDPATLVIGPQGDDGTAIGLTDAPAQGTVLWLAGQLWLAGVDLDWTALPGAKDARRIALPTVRFERSRHWLDPQPAPSPMQPGATPEREMRQEGTRQNRAPSGSETGPGLALPCWRPLIPPSPAPGPLCRIILLDDQGQGEALAEALETLGETVIRARHVSGGPVANLADGLYTADFDNDDQIDALLTRLKIWTPNALLSCLPLAAGETDGQETGLTGSFFDPLRWIRAVDAVWPNRPFRIGFLTRGMAQVSGRDPIEPIRATLGALVLCAAEEFPKLTVHCLDIDTPSLTAKDASSLARDLQRVPAGLAARRGRRLWRPDSQPELFPEPTLEDHLRPGGVYMVIGGLGGIGWTLARYLAQHAKARLVIVSRSIPDGDGGGDGDGDGDDEQQSPAAHRLRDLRKLSPEVLTIRADIADRALLIAALAQARAHFGQLDGVIHSVHDSLRPLLRDIDPPSARAAMAAKVFAGPALVDVLRDNPPDFLVLCSTMAAIQPSRGQGIHAAGSAVLDALAQSEAAPFPILSVNWCSWRDVGAAHDAWNTPLAERPLTHQILRHRQDMPDGTIRYLGLLDPTHHWVVSEHILNGLPTLPGTGVIDLFLAAHKEMTGQDIGERGIALEPLVFLKPLQIDGPGGKAFAVSLQPEGERIHARLEGQASDGRTVVYAHAILTSIPVPPAKTAPIDLSSWKVSPLPPQLDPEFLSLGDRWACESTLQTLAGMRLAVAHLAPAYHQDLPQVIVHPALLDLVTSLHIHDPQHRNGPKIPMFPVCYGAFRLFGPVGASIFSMGAPPREDGMGVHRLSLDLLDQDGQRLGEIEDLTFAPPQSAAEAIQALLDKSGANDQDQKNNPFLADSISPEEGTDVFRRLPLGHAVQIHVAQGFKQPSGEIQQERLNREESGALSSPPPDPRAFLTQLWRRILGTAVTDPNASFFEMGGNSLGATQVLSRVRDILGVPLSMKDFFATPTVNGLVSLIEKAGGPPSPPPSSMAETAKSEAAQAEASHTEAIWAEEDEEWETDVL